MVIKLLMARIEQERAAQELVEQNTARQQYYFSYDKAELDQLLAWISAFVRCDQHEGYNYSNHSKGPTFNHEEFVVST